MNYIIIEKADGKWDVRKKGSMTDSASNLPSKQAALATAKGFIGSNQGHIWIKSWNGFEEVISVNC
ncbi:hypothetical protein [Treponema saccharophilum]|uniref:DUF2188 domain-containing protein n=1 Tax=Treponema saccharophilum DSM 2985 TaxID=907348 RepID=H7EL92_9SPIR|nr:hypothetical protein [Treponema saccharophilum]EIC01624.1 hypothetical protein TresaDRAFT_2013 [Treponema saccharophilum DSM 2985]MBP3281760.1 hypothetical protein [Treponema sp.]BDC96982.1 hypothetical protein TRSA_20810 [Treponema saccharophilum]